MIWEESFKKIFMTDQNSAIEHQIRPDQLQDELGIKKRCLLLLFETPWYQGSAWS